MATKKVKKAASKKATKAAPKKAPKGRTKKASPAKRKVVVKLPSGYTETGSGLAIPKNFKHSNQSKTKN